MPHKINPGSVQEPLELLYRNGEPATSSQIVIPRFRDISLTRDSQSVCDDIIEEAKKYDHRIQSDKECQDFMALHSLVDELKANLRKLVANDRTPLIKILSQISAAIEPVSETLVSICDQLHKRITEYRAQAVEGDRREQERLKKEAEELRNEAKYSDNPQKRRQATVKAKQLEEAAKQLAPKPEKGLDTVEYWEGEITNRALAAKLPDDIVLQEIDQMRLNQRIKALQRAGEKITPNMFPGITLTRKTKVRFHK